MTCPVEPGTSKFRLGCSMPCSFRPVCGNTPSWSPGPPCEASDCPETPMLQRPQGGTSDDSPSFSNASFSLSNPCTRTAGEEAPRGADPPGKGSSSVLSKGPETQRSLTPSRWCFMPLGFGVVWQEHIMRPVACRENISFGVRDRSVQRPAPTWPAL